MIFGETDRSITGQQEKRKMGRVEELAGLDIPEHGIEAYPEEASEVALEQESPE